MLEGRYGHWVSGEEVPWPIPMEDRIAASPVLASLTKYAIKIESIGSFWKGVWSLRGGLIGRVVAPTVAIELFGKEIVRTHRPFYTAKFGRDYSYEFFLVVRPRPNGHGRLIKQWRFLPEEVALTIPPETEKAIRQGASSEKEAQRLIEQSKSHYLVRGFLRYHPGTKTAVVTVMGLKRLFEERVDLARELRP